MRTLLVLVAMHGAGLALAAVPEVAGPAAPVPATAWLPERSAAVDAYVRDAFARAGLPALAVAVVTPAGVVYEAALGTTALRGGRPVDRGDAFEVGSLTKSMTALTLLQLADEGALELSDPVQDHLPWFRLADDEASRSITLASLLTHTSGLPPHAHGVVWRDVPRIDPSVTEAVRALATSGVDGAGRPAYANMNYVVAGAVIEAVTGAPWHDALETRILRPLGMDASAAGLEDRATLRTVTGHTRIFGLLPVETRPSAPFAGPAGSVSAATVGDFAAYLRAWLAPGSTEVVGPSAAEAALAPRVAVREDQAYGLGWRSTERAGRPVAYHPGGTEGAGAFMALDTAAGVGVVVFTNMASSLPSAIGFGLLDVARGDAAPAPARDGVADMGLMFLAMSVGAAAALVQLGLVARRAVAGAAARRRPAVHLARSVVAAAVAGAAWWLVPAATRAMGMPLPFGIQGFMLDVLVTAVLLIAVPTLYAAYFLARLVHDGTRTRAPRRAASRHAYAQS